MAGIPPASFNAKLFREKIRFVFDMALTPDTDRQLTFHFNDVVDWSTDVDGDDVPFDPAATPARTAKDPVTVPCAIEAIKAAYGEQATAFGTILPTRLRVTLLDEDYAQVKTADYVVFDGEKYTRDFTGAPAGLFDVGIHVMTFVAENDS